MKSYTKSIKTIDKFITLYFKHSTYFYKVTQHLNIIEHPFCCGEEAGSWLCHSVVVKYMDAEESLPEFKFWNIYKLCELGQVT